jgi:hypothetical protein
MRRPASFLFCAVAIVVWQARPAQSDDGASSSAESRQIKIIISDVKRALTDPNMVTEKRLTIIDRFEQFGPRVKPFLGEITTLPFPELNNDDKDIIEDGPEVRCRLILAIQAVDPQALPDRKLLLRSLKSFRDASAIGVNDQYYLAALSTWVARGGQERAGSEVIKLLAGFLSENWRPSLKHDRDHATEVAGKANLDLRVSLVRALGALASPSDEATLQSLTRLQLYDKTRVGSEAGKAIQAIEKRR